MFGLTIKISSQKSTVLVNYLFLSFLSKQEKHKYGMGVEEK